MQLYLWPTGSKPPENAALSTPGSDDCVGQTYEKLLSQPAVADEQVKKNYEMLCMNNLSNNFYEKWKICIYFVSTAQ